MRFAFETVKDVLRCPKCRSELVEDGETLISADPDCRLRFAIRDGIPIMLADEAIELPMDEWSAAMQRHTVAAAKTGLAAD
jgi:uncharacterized protein